MSFLAFAALAKSRLAGNRIIQFPIGSTKYRWSLIWWPCDGANQLVIALEGSCKTVASFKQGNIFSGTLASS